MMKKDIPKKADAQFRLHIRERLGKTPNDTREVESFPRKRLTDYFEVMSFLNTTLYTRGQLPD